MASYCPNCGEVVERRYCPGCGQRQLGRSLRTRDLVTAFLGEALELDGRIVRTVARLVGSPGRLTADYVAGRRADYTSPVKLLLFAAIAFTAALSVSGRLDSGMLLDVPFLHVGVDVAAEDGALSDGVSAALRSAYQRDLVATIPLACGVILVIGASILAVLDRARPLAHHLVFGMHQLSLALFTWAVAVLLDADLLGLLVVAVHTVSAAIIMRGACHSRTTSG